MGGGALRMVLVDKSLCLINILVMIMINDY